MIEKFKTPYLINWKCIYMENCIVWIDGVNSFSILAAWAVKIDKKLPKNIDLYFHLVAKG